MYKGLRHAAACSKCGETRKSFITYGEMDGFIRDSLSDCCNAKFEYVGLQPYRESIVNAPIMTFNSHLEEEDPEIKQPQIEKIVEKEVEPESIPTPKKETLKETVSITVKTSNLKISDLLDTSLKINNSHMVPALRQAMEEGSQEKIDLLKAHYPRIFSLSLKYTPKKLRKKFGLLEEGDE